MNKSNVLIVVLGFSAVATLSSCKKSYNCECVTTVTVFNQPTDYSTTTTAYSEKMTEKQAKAACNHEAATIKSSLDDNLSKNGTTSFASASANCLLK